VWSFFKRLFKKEVMPIYTLDVAVPKIEEKEYEVVAANRSVVYAAEAAKAMENNKWVVDDDKQKQEQLALIVENQRLYNNVYGETASLSDVEKDAFKKISMPIAYQIYKKSIIFDLVSVQTFLGPCGILKFENTDGELCQTEIVARAKKLKARYNFDFMQDLTMSCGIDPVVELAMILAQDISLEIIREVLQDLRNNVLRISFENKDGLRAVEKTSKIIESRIGHEANWIVAGDSDGGLLEQIVNSSDFEPDAEFTKSSFGVTKMGRLGGKWDVYRDPLYPADQFLMGFKGNNYQAGYFYGPYVALVPTPVALDPDNFVPRRGLLHRYGKRLENKDYYASVKLER
jgi:hypothetical protein